MAEPRDDPSYKDPLKKTKIHVPEGICFFLFFFLKRGSVIQRCTLGSVILPEFFMRNGSTYKSYKAPIGIDEG